MEEKYNQLTKSHRIRTNLERHTMMTLLRNLIVLLLIGCSVSYKVNITKFENCHDVAPTGETFPVELTSVKYQNDDGFVDTIHGTYIVRTMDTRDKELLITLYQCSKESGGQCNSNAKHYVERLHCERFHGDKSGPWYMISSAMSGSKCGESTGDFTLDDAKLRPEYLQNYLTEDQDNSRYRMRMLFHKKGEAADDIHIRGCLNIEFDLIY